MATNEELGAGRDKTVTPFVRDLYRVRAEMQEIRARISAWEAEHGPAKTD